MRTVQRMPGASLFIREMSDAGRDIDEIAHMLGLTRFQVRAEINRVEPPDHGRAFLLPNTSGLDIGLDGAIQDVRIDPADNKRPRDIVAGLRQRAEARRVGRKPAPCGTPAAHSRHKKKGQDACDACKAAIRDQKRGRTA